MTARKLRWIVAVLVLVPLSVSAQEGPAIDRTGGVECDLVLREVMKLGRLADPVGFHPLSELAVSSDGTVYVSSALNRGEIAVYDRRGEFSGTVGGRGKGPGEFTAPAKIGMLGGDSLFAVEGVSGRFSVFSPNGEAVRTGRLPARLHDFLLRPDGKIVASAPFERQGTTQPLEIVSSTGVLAAFGSELQDDPAETLQGLLHVVSSGPYGSILSARLDTYEIARWSSDGELVRRWTSTPEWFEPGSGRPPSGVPHRRPPPSRTIDLVYDSNGRAWILVAVADRSWAPVEEGRTARAGRMYDTVIDVVDLASGTLVCSSRLDPLVHVTRDGEYLYAAEMSDEDYRRVITLWKGEIQPD